MLFPSATMRLSNSEQVLYSTFRIEVATDGGLAEATGFFAGFEHPNGNNVVALVSSRHVLDGAISVRLWVPIEVAGGQLPECFADVTIQIEGGVVCHPDPNIDLAGFVIHHIENRVLSEGEKLFYRAISQSQIPTLEGWADISVGDDVFVFGCPHGLEDERNRRPLVRKGVIASLPKELERPHFLIDIPTHVGASGSPVVIDSHFAFNREEGTYEARSRFYLVGVVSHGLELHEVGERGEGQRVLADLHLGRVVRSDKLPELYQAILSYYLE